MKNWIAAIASAAPTVFGAAEAACRSETEGALRLVVCEFRPAQDDIRLFLNDAGGAPYGEFDAVNAALGAKGERLAFAMNAGMYHKDRTPVGLYVEDYEELKKISTKDGPGNFHLKPNGVFFVWDDFDHRGAAVRSTTDYESGAPVEIVRYATQSGPMLVINGELHPKFLKDSTSRKRRNGVGVREDGSVVFAISDSAVTFHEFAVYFRDTLKCPNALYLDGTISRLYAPELGRDEPGLPMGPIVGVVVKTE